MDIEINPDEKDKITQSKEFINNCKVKLEKYEYARIIFRDGSSVLLNNVDYITCNKIDIYDLV